MIRFLDLPRQYLEIKSEIDDAVQSIFSNAAFVGGSAVSKFESSFAEYQNASYCVGVANGTDALEIAIEALSLPVGSEIIVPANSFIASSEAVTRCRHKVVFADVVADTFLIDLDDVSRKISSETSAIVAVHLYGQPCDMGQLRDLAVSHGLKLIEDCAQAHGAEYSGRRVGAIGDIGTFSFYPGKNLGAYGDGGAIVTDNEDLARKCRMIANHGRLAKYDHEFEGRNSRLDGLQAAILNVKLKRLENWTTHRIAIADRYLERLSEVEHIVLPVRSAIVRQVYHLFVIRCSRRDELRDYLDSVDIQSGVHYPKALPQLEAYRYLGQQESCPVSVAGASQLVSLPIGDHMTLADTDRVVDEIKRWSQAQPNSSPDSR